MNMKKLVSMIMLLVMAMLCMTAYAAEDAASQIVKNGGAVYFDVDGKNLGSNATFPGGDAVVKINKSIAPTGTENLFEVTLDVETTQDLRTLRTETPDAAALLIFDVSNSMNYCATCGHERGNNHRNNYGHSFSDTRLIEAKAAAKGFLDEFATKTGAQGDDKRYVAIVDFASHAAVRMTWVDVTNAESLQAAKNRIDSLTVAHSGTNWSSDDGGTNIEGALRLAANYWEIQNSVVSNIDYKYTILLTDGNPTYYVSDNADSRNSTSAIYGTRGGGSSTTLADAKDVGTQAKRILDLGSQSKLFSICYGQEKNGNTITKVWDTTPFGKWDDANPKTTRTMTVGQWLTAFSTAAYDGADAQNLFDSFESIVSQIQLAAQAWKVSDTMGPYAVFGGESAQTGINNKHEEENGVLSWDVRNSYTVGTPTYTVNGQNHLVLQYRYKYYVTLDNLNAAYNAGDATLSNQNATLTYAVYNSETDLWSDAKMVEFPKPEIKGYDGELKFKKVVLENGEYKPVSGVEFRLIPADGEASATGTTWSTANQTSENNLLASDGWVTFSGIPSGHDYYLQEVNADEFDFAAPGDIPVSIDWGKASSTSGKFITDGDTLMLLNEKADKSVNLTLSKTVTGEVPENLTIPMHISGQGYDRSVTLSAANNWTTAISGLTPGRYTITETAAVDGYNVNASATFDGAPVTITNGGVTVDLTLAGGESSHDYAVAFANDYELRTGSVSVSKTFWERDHEDLMSGNTTNPKLNPMEQELYEDVVITIGLIDENGNQAEQLTLNKSNNWTDSIDELPEGVYTLSENLTGSIADHDMAHFVLYVNGVESEGQTITIGDGDELVLAVENHYLHHMGDIHIYKEVESTVAGEEIVLPDGHVFYVDVYAAKQQNGGYVKDGNVVTTITVSKNSDGDWFGASIDLPVGWYVLEERASSADGYTHESYLFAEGNAIQVVHAKETDGGLTTSTVYANLTNYFSVDKGTITIEKAFPEGSALNKDSAEIKNKVFHVHVLDEHNNIVDTLELSADSNWQASAQLPLGKYTLEEVTSEGAEGTADVKDYGHTFTWNPGSDVTLDTKGETASFTVSNSYTKDFGHLELTKSFTIDGAAAQADALGVSIEFVIQQMNASGSYTTVDTVLLNTQSGWTKTVNLPVGTYRIFETGTDASGNHYTFNGATVTVNGTELPDLDDGAITTTGFEVQVTGDTNDPDTVKVSAVNHYTKDRGRISVTKAFHPDSDLTASDFGSINVYVYPSDMTEGEPVDTLVLNAGNEWTDTTELLDVGSYIVVEEHDAGENNTAYAANYTLEYIWSEGATGEVTKGETISKTVTNKYTRKTGTLAVRKLFSGVSEALSQDMTIILSVKDASGKEYGPLTLSNANSWTVEGVVLPVGEYTITENGYNVPGYTHLNATFGSAASSEQVSGLTATSAKIRVVADDPTPLRVQITNHYEHDLGVITVQKKFATDAETQAAKASVGDINVEVIDANNHVVATLTLEKEKGYTATTDSLPVGTYTLREIIAAGAANSAYVQDYALVPSWNPTNGIVVLTKNAQATAQVTNTYSRNKGTLELSKTVVSEFAEDKAATFEFKITVYPAVSETYAGKLISGATQTDAPVQFTNGVATVYLKDGEKRTVDLPSGMTYSITETAVERFNVTSSGAAGTIAHNQPSAAGFTNTRAAGSVTVGKTVVSPALSDESKEFSFTATLNPAVTASYLYQTSDGRTGSISFNNGIGTFTLKDGQTITIGGLKADTKVTITEAQENHFTVSAPSKTVTIASNQEAQVSFTNTRKTGELKIHKTVTAPVVSADKVVHFVFDVKLNDTSVSGTFPMSRQGEESANNQTSQVTFTNGAAQVFLHHGDAVTISGLPQGIGYTVSEQSIDGYELKEKSGDNGLIGDTAAVAAFENKRTGNGSVVISKKVSSPITEDLSRKFTFTVTLKDSDGTPISGTIGGNTFDANGQLTFEMEHDDTHTLSDLPVGAVVSVTEAEAEFFTASVTGNNAVVQADASANISFVNVRKEGAALSVSKTVSSVLESDGEKEFGFTITLLENGSKPSYSQRMTGVLTENGASSNVPVTFTQGVANIILKDGQKLTINGLPEGLTYNVTEIPYAGFTATSSNSSGMLNAGTAEVAYTNTRASGVLVVRKHVESDLAADSDLHFDFEIELKDSSGNPVTGEHGALTFDQNGKASFMLKHGESVAISSLASGTYTYTVTEKHTSGFATSHTITNANANGGQATEGATAVDTLEANDIELVLFTNTRKEGSLTVSKQLVSDLPSDQSKVFDFTVTLDNTQINGEYGDITFVDGVGEVALKAGEWATATGLPEGIGYAVTEKSYPEFDTTMTDETGTINGTAGGGMQQQTADAIAVFTNTRKVGALAVNKSVISAAHADHERLFTFTVTLYEGSDQTPAAITQTYEGFVATRSSDPDDLSSTVRDRATGFTNGVSETISLHSGQTLTIEGLPIGVRAVVTETADNGYVTVVNGQAANSASLEVTVDETAVAEFINTRKTGTLTVTKELGSGALDADANQIFGFTLLLTGSHGAPITGTFDYTIDGSAQQAEIGSDGRFGFQLKPGQTMTMQNLPIGANYSVTETPNDAFIVESENATGTITENGADVVFTNGRSVSGLTISKSISGPAAAGDPTAFSFEILLSDDSVSQTFGGVQFTNGKATVTVAGGNSVTITGIPSSMTVSVKEIAHDLYVSSGDTDGYISLDADGTELEFTNTRKTGSLKISKTVTGTSMNSDPGSFDFAVTLTHAVTGELTVVTSTKEGAQTTSVIRLNGHNSFEISDVPGNGHVVISGLPAGVTAVAEEINNGSIHSSAWAGGVNSAKIESGKTHELVCTNTRLTKGLTITKTVVSGFESDKELEFEFKVTLSEAVTGNYEGTAFEDGETTFKLSHGQSKTILGLPVGMGYTIEETPVNGFTTTATGAFGTISEGEIAAFTNTRLISGEDEKLTVGKTVSSDLPSDAEKKFSFTVTLNDNTVSGTFGDMTFNGGVATFELTGGESVSAIGLPIGVEYTVEETAAEGFTTTYTDETGTVHASAVRKGVIEEGKPQSTMYTNTRALQGLIVTKTVVSDFASDLTKQFEFTVTLGEKISKTFGDVAFTDGVATFTLAHGESKTIEGLPTGMTYDVVETPVVGFETMVAQQFGNGVRGRVASADAVTIAFTNTRLTTGEDEALTVTKKLVSALISDRQKEFGFTVTLSDATISGQFGEMTFENGVASFTLKGGESISAYGLPIGIEYTVTEVEARGFASTAEGTSGTIETGKALSVVFTNTRDTGSLKVSKIVSGVGANEDDVFTFVVTIPDLADGVYGDMVFADGKAEVELKHGEYAIATGIPLTAEYSVEETEYAGYAPVKEFFEGVMLEEEEQVEFENVFIVIDLPETGDTSSLILWIALLACTAIGMTVLVRRRQF